MFRSALGLTAADAPLLAEILLRGAREQAAELGRADVHGQRYQVDIPVAPARGGGRYGLAWIIRADEDFPRLVACYVL